MRPSATTNDAEEHECLTCGARVQSPDTRACANCGGELQSLGLSRDL